MLVAACSPSSSIFSEMLELNAIRNDSRRGDIEDGHFECDTAAGEFDIAKSSPIFYGRYGQKIMTVGSVADTQNGDDGLSTRSSYVPDFDPAVSHPALCGYILLDKRPPAPVKDLPQLPDPKECSPREYLESYVFPVLLPGIEKMLIAAKENKVFERRRTKFNACDFLTEYLFKNNWRYKDRETYTLTDIPFVQRLLEENPRPPLPLSLLLSDNEAAIIIQSFYRGYLISYSKLIWEVKQTPQRRTLKARLRLAIGNLCPIFGTTVRKDPEVQELRQYQKEMRNEAVDIFLKIEDFWKKHPVEEADEEVSHQTQEKTSKDSPVSSVSTPRGTPKGSRDTRTPTPKDSARSTPKGAAKRNRNRQSPNSGSK